MRISSAQLHAAAINSILGQQAELSRVQQQIAEGRKILTPADDPAGAARALNLNETISATQQYNKNLDIAESRLQYEEGSLQSVGSLVQRVRELSVQANNDSNDSNARALIATEIRQRFDELLNLANTRDSNNEYIFSGYQAGTEAFTENPDGSVTFNGDEGQRFLQIGQSRQVATNDSGVDVFGLVGGGSNEVITQSRNLNTGTGTIDAGTITNQAAYIADDYTIVLGEQTGVTAGVLAFNDDLATDDTLQYELRINGTLIDTLGEGDSRTETEIETAINAQTATTNVRAYFDAGQLYLANVSPGTTVNIQAVPTSASLSGNTPPVPSSATLTGYTAPVAAAGGENFQVTIDGLDLINVSLPGGFSVTAAQMDTALTNFLGANPGYTVASGSFATDDLVLEKDDGTAMNIIVAQNTTATAGALTGLAGIAVNGTQVIPAFTPPVAAAGGETFQVTIDGLDLINTLLPVGNTVTAAQMDTALTTFLGINPGYTQVSGSFAGGDLVLEKDDGSDLVIAVPQNTTATVGVLSGFTGTITNGSLATTVTGTILVNERFLGATEDTDTVSGFFGSNLTGLTTPANEITYSVANGYVVLDSSNAIVTSGTYVDGGDIDFNSQRLRVSGTPNNGDQFTSISNVQEDLFATLQSLITRLEDPVLNIPAVATSASLLSGITPAVPSSATLSGGTTPAVPTSVSLLSGFVPAVPSNASLTGNVPAIPTNATLTTFTDPVAAGGGETFQVTIDTIDLINTALPGGGTVTGAQMDFALGVFLGANPGYTIASGSFATDDLVLEKDDGSDLVIAIAQNTTATAGALTGLEGTAVNGTLAMPAFTPPIAAGGGETYQVTIDSIDLINTALAGGGTVTAAQMDTALATFLGGNPGYTQVSGSFVTGDLLLEKDDGSDMVIAIPQNTTATASVLSGLTGTANNGTLSVPAFAAPVAAAGGETFQVTIDGLDLVNTALPGGGTVTAGQMDAALAAFVVSNPGYTIASGSFAIGDLVLQKDDGTDLVIAIPQNTTTTVGSLNGITGTATNGTVAGTAFSPPTAAVGGETFQVTIDGIDLINTALAGGASVTAADMDTALTVFLVGNPGYTIVSGSFATDDLVLQKADGTDLVIAIPQNTSSPAGVLSGLTGTANNGFVAGAGFVPPLAAAGGETFQVTIDGINLLNTALPGGGTVTAAQMDTALNVFVNTNPGYTVASGSFASGDLVLEKDDGTDLVIAIPQNTTARAAAFNGLVGTATNGTVADPGDTDVFHNDMENVLNNLDRNLSHVIDIRARIGARLNSIDGQLNLNESSVLQLRETLSEIQDLDFAEAISRLTQQTTSLEAAQQSFLRIQGLSLFNFL